MPKPLEILEIKLSKSSVCPLVMGILNCTPDSFSDGGRYVDTQDAARRIKEMIDEGADIIDIGGESTRPGSQSISVHEEMNRVIPAIECAHKMFPELPLSIDTRKSSIARIALERGACLVNDISGLKFDSGMAKVVSDFGAFLVIMHMKGDPANMQDNPTYDDLIGEISAFLMQQISYAVGEGVARDRIIIDPGIGFGKTPEDNIHIMKHLRKFKALGAPLVYGVSKKSVLGVMTGMPLDKRGAASIAASIDAVKRGADILRVHDVGDHKSALSVLTYLS